MKLIKALLVLVFGLALGSSIAGFLPAVSPDNFAIGFVISVIVAFVGAFLLKPIVGIATAESHIGSCICGNIIAQATFAIFLGQFYLGVAVILFTSLILLNVFVVNFRKA